MIRPTKLLWSSLGAMALVFASCSSDENVLMPDNNSNEVYGIGKKIVSLSLDPESASVGTRADDFTFESNNLGNISDGKKADVLYFTVYKEGDSNTYAAAPEFEKGTRDGLGTGQNKLDVTSWPLTIQLALEENTNYKIALWAQDADCKAFNVTDLTNVKVSYENAKNNDELRDAFCAVSGVLTSKTESEHIILRRPFAQINVGTSGADYKNILQGARVYPNRTFIYSQVEIKGACDQINVLTDVISQSEDFKTNEGKVTFTWNVIPAYFNYKSLNNFTNWLEDSPNEEFLKVKLNKDNNEPEPYLTSYPTYGKKKVDGVETGDDMYLTETFKYMSMCYVLVPATAKEPTAQENPYDKYNGSTINSLKVSFAETADGKDLNKTSAGGTEQVNAKTYISLESVPVHRNWRTNIIGGLSNTDEKTGPDDPTSLFNFTKICIHQDPIYFGDIYNINGTTTGDQGETKLEWVNNPFPGALNEQGGTTTNPDHR